MQRLDQLAPVQEKLLLLDEAVYLHLQTTEAAMTTPSMTKTPSARWMAASWMRRSCPCLPPP